MPTLATPNGARSVRRPVATSNPLGLQRRTVLELDLHAAGRPAYRPRPSRCARRCLAPERRRSARPPRAPRRQQPLRLLDDRHHRPEPGEHLGELDADGASPRTTSDLGLLGLNGVAVGPVLDGVEPGKRRDRRSSPSRARLLGGPRTCGRRPARVRTVEAAAATDEPPALPRSARRQRGRPTSVASARMRVRRATSRDRRRSSASLGRVVPRRARLRPGHHLRGDAAPVRALAADEVRLDADDVEAGVRDALRYQLARHTHAEHDDVSRVGHGWVSTAWRRLSKRGSPGRDRRCAPCTS